MINNNQKILYIIRGLPGSFKSTKALELVNGMHDQYCENDMFYIIEKRQKVKESHISYSREQVKHGMNGTVHEFETILCTFLPYKYDASLREAAGFWCFGETFRKFQVYDTVAVSNVFAKKESFLGYINYAKKINIKVVIINMPSISIEDSMKKNVHNCSKESIEKMYNDFEEFTQDDCDAYTFGVSKDMWLAIEKDKSKIEYFGHLINCHKEELESYSKFGYNSHDEYDSLCNGGWYTSQMRDENEKKATELLDMINAYLSGMTKEKFLRLKKEAKEDNDLIDELDK